MFFGQILSKQFLNRYPYAAKSIAAPVAFWFIQFVFDSTSQPPASKNAQSLRVAGIIFAVALVARFAGLTYPAEVVFDEVHFGKFITAYISTGENFFDIHPPHPKLLIAGAARLAGYTGGFGFEHIGQSYGDVPVFALRWMPALMGAVLPVVVFLLMRQLGGPVAICGLAGLAIALDNAFIVQSRVIGLDMILLTSYFASLASFLIGWRHTTFRRYAWMLGSGALAGIAVGSKLTGLSIFAVLGLVCLVKFLQTRTAAEFFASARVLLVVGLAAAAVYVAGWYAHFALLPNPGPGDAFYKNTGNFIDDAVAMQRMIFEYNSGIRTPHPGSSMPLEWPLMRRPIYYWAGQDSAAIYLMGNPVVWWGALIFFVTMIGNSLLARPPHRDAPRTGSTSQYWIPLAGYLFAYLPLVPVDRPIFLYHYMTPLIFCLMTGLLWIHASQEKRSRQFMVGAIALIVASYIIITPLTYGFRASDFHHSYLLKFSEALR